MRKVILFCLFHLIFRQTLHAVELDWGSDDEIFNQRYQTYRESVIAMLALDSAAWELKKEKNICIDGSRKISDILQEIRLFTKEKNGPSAHAIPQAVVFDFFMEKYSCKGVPKKNGRASQMPII